MSKKRTRDHLSRRRLLELGLAGAAGGLLPVGCGSAGAASSSAAPPDPDAGSGGGAGSTAGGGSGAGGSGGGGRRPPIVYVYFDQLRADMIGAAGYHPSLRTPTLDTLLGSSVRFGNCFTNAALCRPARASMMTGRLPRHHGVISNETTFVADPRGPSHVRDLRDAGYHTAVIGKTHLHGGDGSEDGTPGGADAHLDSYQPILRDWGFDSIVELTGPGESRSIRSAWSDDIGAAVYSAFRGYIQDYELGAKRCVPGSPSELALDPLAGRGQWKTKAPDAFDPLLVTDVHLDVWCARRAARFVREYSSPEPLYLQIAFPGPHSPYDAPLEWREPYANVLDGIPTGPTSLPGGPSSAIIQGSLGYLGRCATPEQIQQLRALYYAKTTMLDAALGEVLSALEDRGWLDEAWIVVGSDHGDMLGSHSLLGKLVFLEEAIRTPLLVRPPGGTAPWTSSALVDQLDVTETLRAAGGLAANDDRSRPGIGRSLLSTVQRGSADPGAHEGKPAVVIEDLGFSAVRTPTRKLVYQNADYYTGDPVEAPVELYLLDTDPDETLNVVDRPERAAEIAELTAMLEAQ